ncbi:hypothetical protein Ddc_04141 [Ditylenchus destructor]|nr:hypothetical protein Ddc_04141 [Ditylenchus destructor]
MICSLPSCSKFVFYMCPSSCQLLRNRITASLMRYSPSAEFSTSVVLSYHSNEKPQVYHLQHVATRLNETVPMIFRMKMDYTFYRDDILLDNQILGIQHRGHYPVMWHMGFIALIGRTMCPSIRAEPLSIAIIVDDGTVRLRWRVYYVSWVDVLLNPRMHFKKYREDKHHWYDGYSIFHVDGDGLVYKATLQKMIPDEPKNENKDKESVIKRIGVTFPGTASYVNERHKEQS